MRECGDEEEVKSKTRVGSVRILSSTMSLATAVGQPAKAPSPAPSAPQTRRPSQTPAVALLRSYLSKLMRIVITDGRIFIGMFACIDKDRNLVLVNTEEFRVTNEPQNPNDRGRYVGMVMIPWQHVVSAEVEAEFEDDVYT